MKAPLRSYLLLLVVALVIPLIGALGFNVLRNAENALDDARAAQRSLSASIAADLSSKIASAHEILRLIADRPQVQAMDPARCDDMLVDLNALLPEFANIAYSDRAGNILCSAIPLPDNRPVNVGATDWFQTTMSEQRFNVGGLHLGAITGKWISMLSVPVRDLDGEIVGAVHLPLDLRVFRPRLDAWELPPNSLFGVIATNGTLIWHNNNANLLIGSRPDWATDSKIAEIRTGDFELTSADGIARHYASAAVPETNWVAFFGVPSAAVTRHAQREAMTSAAVGLFIVLALALFALALARRIERPLDSLTQAIYRFSQGQPAALAEPSGPRELVDLATGFNTMVEDRLRIESELHAQSSQLQTAKDRLGLAMQIAQMGMWSWDLQTQMVQSDDILAQIFGHAPEKLARMPIATWRLWTHPDDLPMLDRTLRASLKGETEQFEAIQRIRHSDGHWISGLWRGRVTQRDAQGQTLTMMGSFHDITERMQAHEKLQLAASVFTHAREGIIITDPRGTIIDVNDMFTQITGYTREEAIGNNPSMLQSGRQGPEFYANLWQKLIVHGHWSGEMWNRCKDGSLYAEMVTISAVHGANGEVQHYVALFTDITQLKEHESQLEKVAHFDALTGLPNRVLLADRLQQSMLRCQRAGQSLAVALLDLDGFKAINDHHGHERGDELLVALAHRLKAALREGDTLSRTGGDEFVAVLVDLEHAQNCEPVLAQMLRAASDPIQISDALLQVSASIGVTLYPADGVDPDLLIRHADQAMYLAKQAGKNRYHLFDVAHDSAIKAQREEIDRLRKALARGEFVLYFQPKVNMRTGQVLGAEALIRWNHPERGLLPPAAFLPAMAGHAISIEVGEWVLATALRQMAQWRKEGIELAVSVNIDALQLQSEGFVPRLAELLAAQPDVPPNHLELEILETSALEDIAQVADIMQRCQTLGVRFALDDFGTGYSSLTYLKRLNAEVIKIDQSFIRDMQSDPDDLAIVKGVIGLAQAFHREVIAEGVETIAHGALLLPLGCERAQGYGIAPPMPASELPGWVLHWKPDSTWKAHSETPR
ncbi:EAL domain-containing protein [Acidovorax sp.]|uniref:bifunctional diguanylate cyclase/phosphodiesterase n=1 Tax=Acidovorax sp. TaxID=1872122 RepID=UPI00260959ED|nr:EAL domain-containing protein [Acidovorax sp.]